eukprot:3618766-Pyramimonas_sp.AAC.1
MLELQKLAARSTQPRRKVPAWAARDEVVEVVPTGVLREDVTVGNHHNVVAVLDHRRDQPFMPGLRLPA